MLGFPKGKMFGVFVAAGARSPCRIRLPVKGEVDTLVEDVLYTLSSF